ncbi:MAG: ATP synthase F1 subunit epsilon [Proteobacteria bacterium]|nr:ATP synthase F1 subunit epsilon [Pseudomonadota bacterium]
MAENFLFEIVTPYRKLVSKEVEEVTAPGELGEFGVLAGHTQYLTLLKPGTLNYKSGSETGTIVVGRGYAEVSHDKTVVLVDEADYLSEIDVAAARDSLGSAEAALEGMEPEDANYARTVNEKELAEARIAAKE